MKIMSRSLVYLCLCLFSFMDLSLAFSQTVFSRTLNRDVNFQERKPTPLSSRIFERKDQTMNLGWFDRPFKRINIKEGVQFRGIPLPSVLSSLREKKWHFFSFMSDKYVVAMAAAHTGTISNFFFYAFDLETRELLQINHLSPFKPAAHVSRNSVTGKTLYQAKGLHLKIENRFEEGFYQVTFNAKGKKDETLRGQIKVWLEGEDLINVREVAPKQVVYTHQNSMYRPEGTLWWNNRPISFDPHKDYATMDYTRGLHRYQTTWYWSAAAGMSEEGVPVAINLAADIIPQGTNDVPAYWIGSRIYRANKAIYTKSEDGHVWNIRSLDGMIDLTFRPLGRRRENTSILGLLQSKFDNPIGYYSGTLRTPEGQTYHVKEMVGLAEEHYAKW